MQPPYAQATVFAFFRDLLRGTASVSDGVGSAAPILKNVSPDQIFSTATKYFTDPRTFISDFMNMEPASHGGVEGPPSKNVGVFFKQLAAAADEFGKDGLTEKQQKANALLFKFLNTRTNDFVHGNTGLHDDLRANFVEGIREAAQNRRYVATKNPDLYSDYLWSAVKGLLDSRSLGVDLLLSPGVADLNNGSGEPIVTLLNLLVELPPSDDRTTKINAALDVLADIITTKKATFDLRILDFHIFLLEGEKSYPIPRDPHIRARVADILIQTAQKNSDQNMSAFVRRADAYAEEIFKTSAGRDLESFDRVQFENDGVVRLTRTPVTAGDGTNSAAFRSATVMLETLQRLQALRARAAAIDPKLKISLRYIAVGDNEVIESADALAPLEDKITELEAEKARQNDDDWTPPWAGGGIPVDFTAVVGRAFAAVYPGKTLFRSIADFLGLDATLQPAVATGFRLPSTQAETPFALARSTTLPWDPRFGTGTGTNTGGNAPIDHVNLAALKSLLTVDDPALKTGFSGIGMTGLTVGARIGMQKLGVSEENNDRALSTVFTPFMVHGVMSNPASIFELIPAFLLGAPTFVAVQNAAEARGIPKENAKTIGLAGAGLAGTVGAAGGLVGSTYLVNRSPFLQTLATRFPALGVLADAAPWTALVSFISGAQEIADENLQNKVSPETYDAMQRSINNSAVYFIP